MWAIDSRRSGDLPVLDVLASTPALEFHIVSPLADFAVRIFQPNSFAGGSTCKGHGWREDSSHFPPDLRTGAEIAEITGITGIDVIYCHFAF